MEYTNGRAHELNQVLKLKEMWCHRDDYGGFLGSLTTTCVMTVKHSLIFEGGGFSNCFFIP